jgi:hypothetical protein
MSTGDRVRFEWIDGPMCSDEDWNSIEEVLQRRGWASLNKNTSCILMARTDNEFAFLVLQLVPYIGPLFIPASMRGGTTAREMATRTLEFLQKSKTRGWLVVAESPFTERICKELCMEKIDSPLYVASNFGGISFEGNNGSSCETIATKKE